MAATARSSNQRPFGGIEAQSMKQGSIDQQSMFQTEGHTRIVEDGVNQNIEEEMS